WGQPSSAVHRATPGKNARIPAAYTGEVKDFRKSRGSLSVALLGYSATAHVARMIPRSGSKNSNSSQDAAIAKASALTGTKPTNASPNVAPLP
ncbi:MAG: hypothetical protein WBF15_02740, partial [Candidatus Sulfotelmatobacter sp.]